MALTLLMLVKNNSQVTNFLGYSLCADVSNAFHFPSFHCEMQKMILTSVQPLGTLSFFHLKLISIQVDGILRLLVQFLKG